jgi:hypothetical protein
MTDETPNQITYDGRNIDGSLTVSASQIQAVQITPPPVITILGENGRPLIAVHPDGRIEYGDGYTPDEAAQAFWDAVERLSRDLQYGAPLNARINAELAAGQQAQRQVDRLDSMAAAWKEHLPEAISRDTAVEAIHQVTRPEGVARTGPRQAAYDVVFAYIRQQHRDFLPTTVVGRNAMIWDAVHAALDAVGIPRMERKTPGD